MSDRYTFKQDPGDMKPEMSRWTRIPGQIRDGDGSLLSLIGTKQMERVMLALNSPEYHLIKVDEDGWALQHPLECRADGPSGLLDCKLHKALEGLSDRFLARHERGTFRVEVDSSGELEIGEREH